MSTETVQKDKYTEEQAEDISKLESTLEERMDESTDPKAYTGSSLVGGATVDSVRELNNGEQAEIHVRAQDGTQFSEVFDLPTGSEDVENELMNLCKYVDVDVTNIHGLMYQCIPIRAVETDEGDCEWKIHVPPQRHRWSELWFDFKRGIAKLTSWSYEDSPNNP